MKPPDGAPGDEENAEVTPDDSPAIEVDEATSPSADSVEIEALPEEPMSLAGEIAALRQERDELRDAALRRRAEFENYRRRVERDRHTAAQDAVAAVFREIVATADNLERALAATGDGEELREGVDLTYRELMGLLESHGVLAVDPEGEPFDPTLHEALLHEPVPGLSEGQVAEVFRKGYAFGQRLLRPALVKVAKGDGAEPPDDDGEAH